MENKNHIFGMYCKEFEKSLIKGRNPFYVYLLSLVLSATAGLLGYEMVFCMVAIFMSLFFIVYNIVATVSFKKKITVLKSVASEAEGLSTQELDWLNIKVINSKIQSIFGFVLPAILLITGICTIVIQ